MLADRVRMTHNELTELELFSNLTRENTKNPSGNNYNYLGERFIISGTVPQVFNKDLSLYFDVEIDDVETNADLGVVLYLTEGEWIEDVSAYDRYTHILDKKLVGDLNNSTNPIRINKGKITTLFVVGIGGALGDNPKVSGRVLVYEREGGKLLQELTFEPVETCYLTTCMVHYYGKSDNGIELTSMRKLREFYKDKHKETLKEYKVISRYIIQGIEKTGNEDYWYGEIKKEVDKIVIWVANKEWEKAEVAYLTLYYRLKDIFYKVV